MAQDCLLGDEPSSFVLERAGQSNEVALPNERFAPSLSPQTTSQPATELLRTLLCEVQRIGNERHMAHLSSRSHGPLPIKMKERSRRVEQGFTAWFAYGRRIVSKEIHHGSSLQETYLTERKTTKCPYLLLKLRHAASIEGVMS